MSKRSKRKNRVETQNNKNTKAKAVTLSAYKSEVHSGPIPSPEALQKYNEVDPQASQIILQQFVKQSNHRMAMESAVIKGNVLRSNLGLFCGTVISISALGVSAFIVSQGHALTGLAGVITSLATLAGVFIYGQSQQRKEREKKALQ